MAYKVIPQISGPDLSVPIPTQCFLQIEGNSGGLFQLERSGFLRLEQCAPPVPTTFYLELEDGVDLFELETGTGVFELEIGP